MHVPRGAVEAKMVAEGLDVKVLDGGFVEAATPEPPPVAIKDDPRYAKYLKMVAMHIPRFAVENKMRAEGLDPSVLDLDPNGPAPLEEFRRMLGVREAATAPPRPLSCLNGLRARLDRLLRSSRPRRPNTFASPSL